MTSHLIILHWINLTIRAVCEMHLSDSKHLFKTVTDNYNTPKIGWTANLIRIYIKIALYVQSKYIIWQFSDEKSTYNSVLCGSEVKMGDETAVK